MGHIPNIKSNPNELPPAIQTANGVSPITTVCDSQTTVTGGKPPRGFASPNFSKERQREIASMGGKSVPQDKRSFSQDRGLAAEAGRKGGRSVKAANRSFSRNKALASAAGKKGGLAVPPEKRSFSTNPELARKAGRKGGLSS